MTTCPICNKPLKSDMNKEEMAKHMKKCKRAGNDLESWARIIVKDYPND